MKDSNEKILAEIMEQFVRIVNKFNRFEKVPMDFGVEEMLYPSEIHTIEAIGNNARINVTHLAELLGISKGAVSQMVNKLVRKQFVKKMKLPSGAKELFLELTPRGKKAFKGHEKFHKDMVLDFLKYTENISHRDFKKFKDIFTKIEHHLELYSGILL